MLRTREEILTDLHAATKRKKAFFRECLLIIHECEETLLRYQITGLTNMIRLYKKRRILNEDKTLYKVELRECQRKLRGLKYIVINEKKTKRTKPSTL